MIDKTLSQISTKNSTGKNSFFNYKNAQLSISFQKGWKMYFTPKNEWNKDISYLSYILKSILISITQIFWYLLFKYFGCAGFQGWCCGQKYHNIAKIISRSPPNSTDLTNTKKNIAGQFVYKKCSSCVRSTKRQEHWNNQCSNSISIIEGNFSEFFFSLQFLLFFFRA